MTTIEHITHQSGDADAWVCICGNTPVDQGFYPCNDAGKIVEPEEGLWKDLYICERCGRIIRQDTLEVIKQSTPNSYSTYND